MPRIITAGLPNITLDRVSHRNASPVEALFYFHRLIDRTRSAFVGGSIMVACFKLD